MTNTSKYFNLMHTLNPRDGVKMSKQFLFESGHVAYLIKGNDVYNIDVAACKHN